MNERIRELIEQAGLEYNYDPMLWLKHEKFAGLIIQECAKSANEWYQNHDKIHSDPMSYVLAHFGVEE